MRQLVILRMVFDAPCYVDNKTLHDSSGTPYVKDEINRLSANYLHRIKDHTNHYVRQLQTPPREDYAGDGPLTPCLKPA